MKLPALLVCISICLLAVTPAFAQKTTHSGLDPAKAFAYYLNSDPNLNHLNFFQKWAPQMRVAANDMVLESQNTDKQNITHYKYQQYHQGLPIFGCHYILHEKDGVLQSANGQFHPDANASAETNMTAASAEALARHTLHSRKYDKARTKSTLCFINPAFPESSSQLRLAYMVDLHSTQPYNKRRYFIDARNGKVLKDLPLIIEEGVPSKAKTLYYGVQDIISDSLGPQNFVLRDPTRGNGIEVYNNQNNSPFYNNSAYWDIANSFKDEVALDAHYCAEKHFDMMSSDYDWKGVDGQNGALILKVHGGAFANAFWDGESTTYGDGDCNYGPLTTLEVVGHEFTHGMIDYTSKLAYYSESGAINESLADMFGKLLERKTDPAHFSWNLAHTFLLSPDAKPFRVMNDPNSLEMPAFYKGLYWFDQNDVHVNSAVGNLWFAMLIDGKQGVNEIGYNYQVPALDADKVGQIVFNTNKNYLTEGADYNTFCNASIEVAGNLFGQGSPEQQAVTEAWKAVGLPANTSANNGFDLNLSSNSQSDAYFVCNLDQFYPVSVSITNLGADPYDPSTPVTLTLNCQGLPDRVITLDQAIAPGESLDILIDDWFKAPDYGYYTLIGALDADDNNEANNYLYNAFNVVEFAANDLELGAYFLEPECFQNTQSTILFVTNNSCEPIPSGTHVKIVANNTSGVSLWSSPTLTIQGNLFSGDNTFFIEDLPIFTEPATLVLLYAQDPDPSNNKRDGNAGFSYLPIVGDYLNTFEVNNGFDQHLDLNYPSNNPFLYYQNNHAFASTGNVSDPVEFEHCADPFSVFNDPYAIGLNASINACIDMSASPAPTLEFDVTLFLNATSNADNYLYSSMLQAKWNGDESGSQIIYNQPDGQTKHTVISLPPHFKGELGFYPYTEVGQGDVYLANLGKDDFVLIDNIKLSAPTTATHESTEMSEVKISPNPAQNAVSIQSPIPLNTIRVFNAAWQLLQTHSVNGVQQELRLEALAPGMYYLTIEHEDGSETIHKLVKMN